MLYAIKTFNRSKVKWSERRGFEPATPCTQNKCATKLRSPTSHFKYDTKDLTIQGHVIMAKIISLNKKWGGRWDLNPRQPESQSGALPTELRPPFELILPSKNFRTYTLRRPLPVRKHQDLNGASGRIRTCDPRLRRPLLYPAELRTQIVRIRIVVGETGFEPATPCTQNKCATKLNSLFRPSF